jgi:flavin-binding protein dodecin
MAVMKVVEILAQSPESWEAATKDALAHASKTIRNIRSIYIKDMMAEVENDQIVQYRVNAKITFRIEG